MSSFFLDCYGKQAIVNDKTITAAESLITIFLLDIVVIFFPNYFYRRLFCELRHYIPIVRKAEYKVNEIGKKYWNKTFRA